MCIYWQSSSLTATKWPDGQGERSTTLSINGGKPLSGRDYLAEEVCSVRQDRPLVGARPDVVLHHVLLLRQVAVELKTDGESGK